MDKLPKRINIAQTLGYLSHAFAEACKNAAPAIGTKNTRGSKLYKYQVDFCYFVNEIERGPDYIVPKMISNVNNLIDELNRLATRG